jgi:hypothetical protein
VGVLGFCGWGSMRYSRVVQDMSDGRRSDQCGVLSGYFLRSTVCPEHAVRHAWIGGRKCFMKHSIQMWRFDAAGLGHRGEGGRLHVESTIS